MTIAAWLDVGLILGLLSRIAIPISTDGGNKTAAMDGIGAAFAGGGLAVVLAGGEVSALDPFSVGWGANGAMYTLFACRCLASRGR